MSNTVIIKPKKNSRKFLSDAKMYQGVMRRNADGSESLEDAKELGAYNKEKFIGSRQISRIAWSDGKNEYPLGDIEQEELDKLVKACGFRDEQNKLIVTADRKDYSDPFFQHRYLKIHKEEGEVELDMSNPINKIFVLNAENRSQYKSEGHNNPVMSARTKYYLTNRDDENLAVTKDVDNWIELGQLLGGLDSKKLLKVGVAMNLGVQQNSSPEFVKNTIASTLRDSKGFVKGTTESYQAAFIRLAKSDSEELDTQYKVILATRKGFLRKKKEQGWLFNGKPVATTDSQLVPYFSDPVNQDDYFELENLVGSDTNKNSTKKSGSKAKSTE